jgi:hypothetical protein
MTRSFFTERRRKMRKLWCVATVFLVAVAVLVGIGWSYPSRPDAVEDYATALFQEKYRSKGGDAVLLEEIGKTVSITSPAEWKSARQIFIDTLVKKAENDYPTRRLVDILCCVVLGLFISILFYPKRQLVDRYE